ncbi:MAG: tetratricopeptide repeat protein [Luteitalea sp.]|nr:tetratricopeptide repeat protein [Luteitalea sp.]
MTSHDGGRRRSQRVPPQRLAPADERAAPRGPIFLALAVFAVAFSVLQVVSYTQKSAIWDEPVHLTTGYVALAERDYRVEVTHPPFIRMWAALPLLFMRDIHLDTSVIDRTAPADWHSGSTAYDFSTKFLYVDNDADRLLNAARFMIVIWGVVLGILLFCWTYEWLGFAPAVCALVFYTLSPNVMANASLVTTDIGITCFIFGTIYFLWRTCRRVSAFNLAGLSVFFALAIVTKFSALILGPLVVSLLIVATTQRSAVTARAAAAIVVLLAVASFVAVWAVYGFQYAPSRSPSWVLHLEQASLARTVPVLAAVTGWIDGHHLLPNIFTEGFLMFAQSMKPPNYTFLAGAYSTEGWWYYFPVAFLIKTPIPFIALLAIGLFVCVQRRRELGWMNEAFIVLPVVIYLAAAVTNTHQVGLRHILPLYPFFLLTAAAGAMALVRRRAGRLALASLTILWLIVLASVYPHTLTFFNRFVGGPRNGYKYLADSNIDWGQGLKLLKKWMDREGVSHIGLAYFGTADPAYYGIDYTPLPAATPSFVLPSIARPWAKPRLPGYVAVGATVLTGVYHDLQWQLFYRDIRNLTPVEVIGNSIFVYWLERWPEANAPAPTTPREIEADRWLGDELVKGQWFEHAIVHYRRYLERRPNEPEALLDLGLALVSTGALEDAIPPLRRAVGLAPEIGIGQLALAATLFDARRDLKEVIAHARRAVTLLPSDPTALVMLARALAISGQLGEAATLVDRALEINPSDRDARELLQKIRVVTESA